MYPDFVVRKAILALLVFIQSLNSYMAEGDKISRDRCWLCLLDLLQKKKKDNAAINSYSWILHSIKCV